MPTRHEAVVELLAPGGGDHVVEIGCGHGVAATLVLARLTTGTYLGIDRSAAMIAAARARNAGAIAAGRAAFVEAELTTAGGDPCDRLFAARVRALATPGGLAVAHRWLRPGGTLLLAMDAPDPSRVCSAAQHAAALLPAAGFRDVARHTVDYDGGAMAAVTALRS